LLGRHRARRFLNEEDIHNAASWIAEPGQGGARRRTMFDYEQGLIWGNHNYRTNGALVNIALASGYVSRPGGGCVGVSGRPRTAGTSICPTGCGRPGVVVRRRQARLLADHHQAASNLLERVFRLAAR
jgi:anaerobic selenocysteine-containing dehydrogenase